MIDEKVLFPIKVEFDDGEIEFFQTVCELECDLEVFDSDIYTDCKVSDAKGNSIRLKVSEYLVLETLEFLNQE